MSERILFLTGRLAEPQLHRVLDSMQPTDFAYQVRNIGISVAALMTPSLIQRRLADTDGADRILLPGRCKGGLDGLADHFGVPVERGPEDLKDLPVFFGRHGEKPDLSGHDCLIFAEITDAPLLDVAAIMALAATYKEAGAEVIDLGCLPDTPFPHLEEAISALKAEGYRVSVDSADARELLRGGKAGADYLLSLTEETLSIADEVDSVPVLIPAIPGDMDSLKRAIEIFQKTGRPFLADPILDPLHFGFTESLVRYRDLRRDYPDIDILMGIGNLTELTDADTTGITALLMGVVSELDIAAVLVVQVSAHCRRAVREADLARRIMSF
ncbi:MAG: dihydropteroate synthase, partial [Rhodospirillaceae bacterium]|nr:dihydropteroate synthase [Rhodospirillaceae bacterium]